MKHDLLEQKLTGIDLPNNASSEENFLDFCQRD